MPKVRKCFNGKSCGHPTRLLSELKPTQLTVGMREVDKKIKDFGEMAPAELEQFVQNNPIIVVLGPDNNTYVIDHHHLALALLKMGRETVPVHVEADLSNYSPKRFWREMGKMNWVYLEDENGVTKSLKDLPEKLTGLTDNIYRSLAWFVRKAGGYKKVLKPFTEFKWASFFRSHPELNKEFVAGNFDQAVDIAKKLCHTAEAKHLPGWYLGPEQPEPQKKQKKGATRPQSASGPG